MTAITSSTNLSLQQQEEQHIQQPAEVDKSSSPTNNKTTKTKKPRTKVKYNSNGSSTTSFKLDKECVNTTTTSTTTTTATNKKKRSPKSKITFVDESEAGNESDHQKQQECTANANSSKPASNFNGAPRTVNKRLCKLRKQLKSCDHFTDNYFVIDLNNKGGQKTSTPQVVSFKSPTEHFILHEDEEDATHSEDDSSINSTDGSSDEKTNKRKRKENKSSSKKQKQDNNTTITNQTNTAQPNQCNNTYIPPELKPADNIMASQLLNSLVDTMNTLSAELKKQDSSVVAHLLQQLLQQNGSELFKQMQQQIIAQFQTEFQNLMSQAITQQMAHNNQMFTTPFFPNDPMLSTNDIIPQDSMSTEQEFYELLNDSAQNSQYLSRWNHIDVRPTSPLTLEKPATEYNNQQQDTSDKQSFLLEQGDCAFDSLFSSNDL